MFGKKKKIAKEAAERDAQEDVRRGFAKQLDETEFVSDPAERFLKLETLQQSIDAKLEAEHGAIKKKIQSRYGNAAFGASMGTIAGAAGVAVSLHFPPLIFVAIPVLEATKSATQKSAAKALAKAEAKNAPYFQSLEKIRGAARGKADVILQRDIAKLADSKSFSEIMARVPRARDHFAAAFAKRVEQERKYDDPAPKRKPPGDSGFKL